MKLLAYYSSVWTKDVVSGRGCRLLPVFCFLLSLGLLSLSGCGTASVTGEQAQDVNGFGVAANHGHALLALPDNTLLLATHFGLYRSADQGRSWNGPDPALGSMMISSLSASPLNSQRVYVLAETTTSGQAGTVGLYLSSDEGRSWQLASAASSSGKMFTAVAGNSSINEVYAYVPAKGNRGLLVSEDGGKHFTARAPIPFARLNGILALPSTPGHLLIYSSDGAARSNDGGKHWSLIKDLSSSVYSIVVSDPQGVIYASSDQGIYSSHNGGASFKQASTQSRNALTTVPDEPLWLYGKTGRLVYKSEDGGRSWKPLPALKGNLEDIAPDPHNVADLYLSLSYPMELYHYDNYNSSWSSLTPKVRS